MPTTASARAGPAALGSPSGQAAVPQHTRTPQKTGAAPSPWCCLPGGPGEGTPWVSQHHPAAPHEYPWARAPSSPGLSPDPASSQWSWGDQMPFLGPLEYPQSRGCPECLTPLPCPIGRCSAGWKLGCSQAGSRVVSKPRSSVSALAAASPREATGEMTSTEALCLQSLVQSPRDLPLPCR